MASGKDFDFNPVREAGCCFDKLADAAVVDATFAHEAAVVEHVGGRSHPIAHVEADDAFARAFHFLFECGIPPDVVNVGRDADPFVANLIKHVVALADGIHRATAVGIHRVEWFDGKFNAYFACVVDQRGDAFGDVFAVLNKAEFGFSTTY